MVTTLVDAALAVQAAAERDAAVVHRAAGAQQ